MTVKPFVSNDYASNVTKFPVFLENQNKLYLPKHYGLEHFGEPEEDKTTGGLDIDLEFKAFIIYPERILEKENVKEKNLGIMVF